MEHFFWVSFGRPFCRAWFRACVCISDCLPCVQMPLLVGRGSIKGPMGRASLSITLLLTSKEPFCAGVLTSRMRNTRPLIFYLGRAQLPLLIVLLLIFWSFSLQGMNLQLLYPGGGGHLSPASKGGSQPNSASDSTQEEQWSFLVFYVAKRMAVKPGHPPFPALICTQQPPFLASQVVLVVKNLPANAGDIRDAGSIPASGRSPGEGNGSPLQHSCLEKLMG